MGYEVRPIGAGELHAAWELTRLSFGLEPEPPATWTSGRPGRLDWGIFDGAGRLVAKATDREQQHWFGGRLVPACGIAGVAVVPDLRGTGLGRLVLERLLMGAHERGAVIATLFRTGPGPYRRLGCEEVGALTWTAVPAAALATVARPPDVTLRPAERDDVPAVLEAYRTVARAGAGLLERSGPLFDTAADAVLSAHDGLTVAVLEDGPGRLGGYAAWDRGPGYDASGRLEVPDLIGLTAPATEALLSMLGSWSAVAPAVALRLPDPDPAPLLAPFVGATVESHDRWMLRVLDAPAAVAARGWPPHLAGATDLAIDDDTCPWNAGRFRLVVEGGEGRLEPGGGGTTRIAARGLAVLYAGAADPALVRRAGLLSGGDEASDAFLAAATAGPPPALLDYF